MSNPHTCQKCLCTTCGYNAENHADGLCRQCECCRENNYEFVVLYTCDEYRDKNPTNK